MVNNINISTYLPVALVGCGEQSMGLSVGICRLQKGRGLSTIILTVKYSSAVAKIFA
jgi:hypothetical protein